jgi:hypothetical protein
MTESCHGESRKRSLVERYTIKPIGFYRLLNGQQKPGCCGTLTDRYYAFSATAKYPTKSATQDKEVSYFYVGLSCASQFLELNPHPPLPLFDPLRANNNDHNNGNNGGREEFNNQVSPINRELINAINLLLMAWNEIPNGFLGAILKYTKENMERPNYNGVVWFNDVVRRDPTSRNFETIVRDLRANNDFRDFTFEEMHRHLNATGKTSNIR